MMKSTPNLDKILHKIWKRNPEQHLKILLTSHLEEESTMGVDQQKKDKKIEVVFSDLNGDQEHEETRRSTCDREQQHSVFLNNTRNQELEETLPRNNKEKDQG